jgi:hypothetical protein
MDDPRYKQLADLSEKELQASKSKYAFIGFGRSTDNVKAEGAVAAELQKMNAALANIIMLEAMAREGADVGKALGAANQQLNKLKNETTKRTSKLGSELLSASSKLENRRKYNITTNRIRPAKKSFNLRETKTVPNIRSKSIKSDRLSRPITAIISSERGKKLSSSRI